MRGKIGNKLTKFGDIMYDYSKIYQSLIGYDFILNDKEIDIEYIDTFVNYFEKYIVEKYDESIFEKIRKITSSHLLSLIPLHDNIKCVDYYKLSKKLIL